MKSFCLLCLVPGLLLAAAVVRADEPVSFRQDIAPILRDTCLACHGPGKAEGGYRVDTYEQAMAEGDSLAAGFEPEDVDLSEAYRRIVSEDAAERMPLDADPLADEQIALLRQWIEQGATFDGPDPKAHLVSVIPPPEHPDPPPAYPHTLPITALAFSADGGRLVASGYHELTVWNPEDGQLLARITNVGQRTYGLDLSSDGHLLAVACGAPGRLGEVRLFEPAEGDLVGVLGTTSDVVLDAAFNPAGDRLAAAGADGAVRVFDVASGDELVNIASHSDWVMAVAWHQDGSRLASASRDKTAKVFDAQTGELLVTYSGHGQPVQGVAFHPQGKEIYSSGSDRKLHRWKIEDGKKSAEVGLGGEVYKLHRGGQYLFAPSADKTVRQLEADSHSQVRSYTGHQDWALSAAYHGPTHRLATGSFDGQVRVWNTENGELVVSFVAAPGQ